MNVIYELLRLTTTFWNFREGDNNIYRFGDLTLLLDLV